MPANEDIYIETIHLPGDEQISLHLTRHLPLRLVLGTVVIIHERPTVLLAVVRKRWMQVIREIERERSSTLDKTKRAYLEQEIARMRSYKFSVQGRGIEGVDALLMTHAEARASLPCCFTMYVLDEGIQLDSIEALAAYIEERGLLVLYHKDKGVQL
ncbi:MAG TPA: hypothetical protein VD735_06785 [Candidatus Saccharimonadales bacterium]|nr:hypothetical protein [Candidatus Saccharimonadales bacterium]